MYNGLWFSPERQALQALIDETQKFNSGTVRLKLYKVSPSILSLKDALLGLIQKALA